MSYYCDSRSPDGVACSLAAGHPDDHISTHGLRWSRVTVTKKVLADTIENRLEQLDGLRSEEGRKKIFKAVFVSSKFECCGSNKRLLDEFAHIPLSGSAPSMMPGGLYGYAIICAVLQCERCGTTSLHDLAILGLIDPLPASTNGA